jgi:hypothetical protein
VAHFEFELTGSWEEFKVHGVAVEEVFSYLTDFFFER